MKKSNLVFIISLIVSTLCLAQKQWKYEDLMWCPKVLPAAMDLLLQKPHLTIEEDSIVEPYTYYIAPPLAMWINEVIEGCVSENPRDCYRTFWLKQEAVTTIRAKKRLLDRNKIKEIEEGVFIEKRFYDEAVVYILCQADVKAEIQKELIEALCRKKYFRKMKRNETEAEYDSFCEFNFMSALTEYQKEEGFPEGLWEEQTLIALKVVLKSK